MTKEQARQIYLAGWFSCWLRGKKRGTRNLDEAFEEFWRKRQGPGAEIHVASGTNPGPRPRRRYIVRRRSESGAHEG